MNIAYFEPLNRAWQRMVNALFKPFDMKKWFVVGFCAFLSELMSGNSGPGSLNYKKDFDGLEDLREVPGYVMEWLAENPVWATLIVIGIIILIAVIIVLTWINSRGKFMFVDNVVYDRAAVAEPWRKYAHLGNSLFWWQLGFGAVSFIIVASIAVAGFFSLGLDDPYDLNWVAVVFVVLLIAALVMVILFITAMVNGFVVPIMFRHNLKVLDAWREFLKIFGPHFFSFVLYALFLFLMVIAAGVVVIAAGFAMCCIGFILLVIPYISTVVTLPIIYLFRAYSIEFLAQFGIEYTLFPDELPPVEPESLPE